MAVFRSPFDEVTPRPYRDRRFAAVHESGPGTKERSSECLPMCVDWGAPDPTRTSYWAVHNPISDISGFGQQFAICITFFIPADRSLAIRYLAIRIWLWARTECNSINQNSEN
jgi:hypothetical protein